MLVKNNKKREAALKNEAGGDEKHRFFLLGLTKQDTQKKSKIKNDNERSSSSFGPGLSPSLATARLKFQGYSTDSSTSTPLNQFKQQHLAEKNLSYPKIIGEPTNSSLVSGS